MSAVTYTFKLSRRVARLRAPIIAALVLTLIGCDNTESFSPDAATPPETQPTFASASFAGGIPIGIAAQPTSEFGERYNGALRNIWPQALLEELAAIKSRGGRVVLMFAGNPTHYQDAGGHFSLEMWKERVDRFKGVNFGSYVSDGTIVAHYLIDEPQDPVNWNGRPLSGATVEEMAKYSKQLWPDMATVVRAEPGQLSGTVSFRYLDAAWAQYVTRKGSAEEYVRRHVADAQERGLGLIVGLNILKGGNNGSQLSAGQVEEYGSALLSSTYPCAFISWKYSASYLESASMKSAMDALRRKAESRSQRSCRGSDQEPPSQPSPTPPPPPAADPLPFGLSHAPIEEYSTRWTGALYAAEPASLVSRLERAESAGMKIVVMLAGAAQSRNSDGTFSLSRWKAQVDRYRSLKLGPHISSKTLYLHQLAEQPACASCWGGKAISWATIEEMARYSKSIWPTLPTTVRVAPSILAQASFRWTHLDAGWAQYNTRKGDLKAFLATEGARARQEGLGLVAGFNVLDGAGLNTAPMTPTQVREFGTILAKEPSVCALVGWKHDPAYLSQPGMREAFDAVAARAKRRSPAPCVVN
jgi:hypothetical protein